ncbi:MAG: DUF4256 domain-containing protein [Brevinematales bacterium]|nr:DUF4256 domain-containing protein [Brevinematales bacterium]
MEISLSQREELVRILRKRFEENPKRHPNIAWISVQKRLESNESVLFALFEMERTGGEPDVIRYDEKEDTYMVCDCSLETPVGRRNLCYDREGWESRKESKPEGNACDMAKSMGIELLTEEDYRYLQTFGPFDTKTSSWLKTPLEVRERGGALFGEFRYGRVFVYHNGAQAYYRVRGFRGKVSL